MDFPQTSWDLAPVGMAPDPLTPPEKRYSLRLLRYWFIQHLLAAEQSERSKSRAGLTICEIEPDLGQLLAFIRRSRRGAPRYATWDAASIAPWPTILHDSGYGRVYKGHLSRLARICREAERYDAIVLLHTLDRVDDPAGLLADLMPCLRDDGVFVGGLNRRQGGISVRSLKNTARRLGLTVEFLGGTFLLPNKGLVREDHVWWIRGNLFLGAVFPTLSTGLYWVLRKGSETRNVPEKPLYDPTFMNIP